MLKFLLVSALGGLFTGLGTLSLVPLAKMHFF